MRGTGLGLAAVFAALGIGLASVFLLSASDEKSASAKGTANVAVAPRALEVSTTTSRPWSGGERAMIRSLALTHLAALPASPSNAYADDPAAAALGQRIFLDPRFSGNGAVSCASCHRAEEFFTDGRPRGVGVAAVERHTMGLTGVAYSPWLFWDGRADSLWRQALGPLEDLREHGGTRTQYAHVLARHYRADYAAVFDPLPEFADTERFPAQAGPNGTAVQQRAWQRMRAADRAAIDRVFANIGKALEAYQRRLAPAASRFDAYATALAQNDVQRADALLAPDEQTGLAIFIGKGNCVHCHNGPLFTNNDFHNTGVERGAATPLSQGRLRGARLALDGEFTCLGVYSDAPAAACAELRFIKIGDPALAGAFRTPSLRNVAETAPYMHDGQLANLAEVIQHYLAAPASNVGKSELQPLPLTAAEQRQLIAFLRSLTGNFPASDPWRRPPG